MIMEYKIEYTFESSVNSYGGKTPMLYAIFQTLFESSVNSYGGKTQVF